jgi:NAD+ diphosphatase
MIEPLPYAHPALDRAADRRRDEAWLAEVLARPETRLVPVWRAKSLIAGPRDAPTPVLPSAADAWWREAAGDLALLGLVDGVAHVAVDVSHVPDPRRDPVLSGLGAFVDLRTCGPLLAHGDAALLAHARALMWWHTRHRFCGVCGHATESREAGYQRRCGNPDCRALHFPRIDPAIIVLVHDGERVVLGRQKGWPAGMHSVLAGFLEPGESLEDCVRREVREETGLELETIGYYGSQPWPFPQSVMLGFVARAAAAAATELRIDAEELEHAAWYDRPYLRACADTPIGTGAFALPRKDSIARRMVDAWIDGDCLSGSTPMP